MDGIALQLTNELTDEYLIKRFVEDCRLRGLAKKTIMQYGKDVETFSKFLEVHGKKLVGLDKEATKEYIHYLRFDRKITQRRIENIFSALSTFYEFLIYEDLFKQNIILKIRKRYLHKYKKNGSDSNSRRKLISVEEMANFVNSVSDTRDKAIVLLLAKTGIRREELISIDLDDVDWSEMGITLKPKPKRSNRLVFFDYETAIVLRRWISKRNAIAKPDCKALFVSYQTGERLKREGVYNSFIHWAERAGLHNPNSDKIEDHFTPHCCRHWFTTHLRRAGMPREFIQELRGDARREAIDIYDHIDKAELKKSYMACIPKLGVV